MAKISVVHQGLGLWIEREAYWEVLFPVAENERMQDDSESLEPHFPRLHIPAKNSTTGKPEVVELTDSLLDLRGVAVDNSNGSVKSQHMIGLKAEPGVPARDTAAFDNFSTRVQGAMILPRARLTPGKLIEKVRFKAAHGLELCATVQWTSDVMSNPGAVTCRNRKTGTTTSLPVIANPNGGEIDLFISNLSNSDWQHQNDVQSYPYFDDDFAAHYTLTSKATGKRDVPEVVGPPTTAPAQPPTELAWLGFMASEDHLCSAGYLDEP
jgi:hypothetical protein